MMYFSRAKRALILGVSLLGLLLCLPNLFHGPGGAAPGWVPSWMPWRQVRLGLDLRGGSYLLLQVDMRAVARGRLDTLADEVRDRLGKAEIGGWRNLHPDPDHDRLELVLRDPARMEQALAALRPLAGTPAEFALDGRPDGTLSLALRPEVLRTRARAAVDQSIEIVRRRIDETGVIDPQIARQGDDRLVVQLPGIDDPGRVKQLLGQTAHMTFQLVDDAANPAQPPPNEQALPMEQAPALRLVVRRHVDVDGASLTDARAGQNPQTGDWVVDFTFDRAGTARFAEISAANVDHRFAIVLDGRIVSAPVIREPITGGRGQISGSFTAQGATDLAVLLRAGALPAPLAVVEERSIGPELGADSIRAGALALAVGLVLVVAFMAGFYGLFGWYANAALVVNLVLQVAVLSLLQATLTLPGMAGILLTLGMAVDANILVNERIREEARAGRTPLAAMEAGFRRAYATVIDSQATAFLAHVMLFVFGTGPVRGFAVTITVGIATTLFTAILFARMLMVRWYAAHRPATLPV